MKMAIGGMALLFLVCAAEQGEAVRSSATLVTAKEPGTRMTLRGIAKDRSGKPITGAKIYLYHTDARGLYNNTDGSSARPRLKANLVTGPDGRYEIRTIKPASYPGFRNPAHIHVVASAPRFRERELEIVFEGDPYLTPEMKASQFMVVRPLSKGADATLQTSYDIVLERQE